jgi:transposase
MTNMYDTALRVVARWYYDDLKSMKKVAERMSIGIGTVWRWLNNVHKSNRICQPIKLTDSVLGFLKALLDEESTLTQLEMSERLREAFGIYFSRKCIALALSKIHYSRKRLSKRGMTDKDKQTIRKQEFRDEYFTCSQNIISLDEVGFDYKVVPKTGYSMKGTKCISHCLFKQRKRLTIIMAIDSSGHHHYKPFYGRVDSSCFVAFVKSLPWKDCNVILDNASIHKTKEVLATLSEKQLHPLFIPPCTPECNPIENVFSVIKSKFRKLLISFKEQYSYEELFARSLDMTTPTSLYSSVFRNTEKYLVEKST